MMIPDIRSKTSISLYDTEEKENAYYQGYLTEKDATFLAGYDVCAQQFENFISSLEFTSDTELSGELAREKWDEIYKEFLDRENTDDLMDIQSVRSPICRAILTLARELFLYTESERDSIGVSMIESMEDKDYELQVEKCKSGYKNILLRIEESQGK